jgi:phage terminase large subunit GpA-like protein
MRDELFDLHTLFCAYDEHETAAAAIDAVFQAPEHAHAVQIREARLVDLAVVLRAEHEHVAALQRTRERDGARPADRESHGAAGKYDPTAQGEEGEVREVERLNHEQKLKTFMSRSRPHLQLRRRRRNLS